MGKFVAQKTVERITWDFSNVPHARAGKDPEAPKHVEGEHVQGTLVEPDEEQVGAFLGQYQALQELGARALTDMRKKFSRIAGLPDDDEPTEADVEAAEDTLDDLNDIYHRQAVICRDGLNLLGVPADLLEQLPPRHLVAFTEHVAGELQGEGVAVSSIA